MEDKQVLTVRDELRQKISILEGQLTAARKALELLEKNPDVEEGVELVHKVRRQV